MSGVATFDFTGKVILITGGGAGIGKGMGEAFARAGGTVVVTGRRQTPLEKFCAENKGASFVQMDVGVSADRSRTIDTVIERHGRLDVLINNALSYYGKPFDELSMDEVEEMIRVLLVAAVGLSKLALPHLIKTKGCVINTSSVAGRYVPYPALNITAYSAAKAGVNQLTRTLASELAPKGVRFNAVAPGFTRSEASETNDVPREWLSSVTPMARMGEPIDIAKVAMFLASDAADWVTGQVIDASGGWGISG